MRDPARDASRSLISLLLAAVLGGCAGISDPYQTTNASTNLAAVSSATTTNTRAAGSGDPAGERGGSIPAGATRSQSKLAPGAGSSTPQAALIRYGSLWVNWTAQTIAHQQRQLAGISLDQARAQALQAAVSLQNDTQLTQNQVSNTGGVIAATPGQGPAAGQWVVVTEETTTGQGDYQGLPPTLHVIYAQLTHTRQGWVVSRWSPQT